MLTLLLLLLGGIPSTFGTASFQLVDSATAQSVNQSTSQPINETLTFSRSEPSVYSWLHLANVQSPSHTVTWDWISPNHARYYNTSYTISDPGPGKTWQNYYVWSNINVAGYGASNLQGLWEIDVYIDGVSYQTQYFTIASSAVEIQPVEGYSWPYATIPVYVQPNPSYATADVERAMLQWSFSQSWFQKTYALQSAPLFSLVLSNDSSSPVRVSFNQTQTSSNWGWTTYHYYYDASGRFTSVSCSVSIILTTSMGIPLNDIALQDIALHELGHCLGLWHTARATDLMNHFSGSFITSRYPSTLNLYALYELSRANQVSQVSGYYSLPTNIGYTLSPGGSNSTTTTPTTTTSESTTTSTSSTPSATSSIPASTSTTTASQSPSTTLTNSSVPSKNTSQSTGIPEFPYQLALTAIFSVVIITSYLFIRYQRLVNQQVR